MAPVIYLSYVPSLKGTSILSAGWLVWYGCRLVLPYFQPPPFLLLPVQGHTRVPLVFTQPPPFLLLSRASAQKRRFFQTAAHFHTTALYHMTPIPPPPKPFEHTKTLCRVRRALKVYQHHEQLQPSALATGTSMLQVEQSASKSSLAAAGRGEEEEESISPRGSAGVPKDAEHAEEMPGVCVWCVCVCFPFSLLQVCTHTHTHTHSA